MEKNTFTITIKNSNGENILHISEIRETIRRLHEYRDIKIEDLNKAQKKDYNFFIDNVKLTSGTSNYYYIVSIIKEFFKEDDIYSFGTVGAYLGGCFLSSNFENNSCTPLCAGSFNPEGVAGKINCDYMVVIFDKNNEKYTVVNKKLSKNNGKCYIFVKQGLDYNSVMTNKLHRYLSSENIKEYCIVIYDSNNNYTKMTNAFIPLQAIDFNASSKKSNLGVGLAVLLVIIFFIVLAFLFLGVIIMFKKD